jgi:hypothetical protein
VTVHRDCNPFAVRTANRQDEPEQALHLFLSIAQNPEMLQQVTEIKEASLKNKHKDAIAQA